MSDFKKFNFQGIGEREQVIAVIHRNWFNILQQYFLVILMAGVLFAGIVEIPLMFKNLSQDFRILILFIKSTFAIMLWLYAFLIWIDYYFDIWIITSERIINVEQKGLFMRHVSEAKYGKIQDVSAAVVGLFPTMLNYGDVMVQTAGEEANITFRKVSDPYHIKNIIMQLQKNGEIEQTRQMGRVIGEAIEK